EDLEYAAGAAVLVYRARSEPDLVFRADLEELAAKRGIAVHYLLGPRATSRTSWLPQHATHLSDVQALRSLLPDLQEYDVFVCGPDLWMDAVCAAALAAGLPSSQLHQERFTW
ncbi:MAG: oxidoreductase, partial [Frankiales bacterium]|nr:oxidoreductase [Frankiales bacterium]